LNSGWLMVFAVLWGTALAFEMPSRQALMMDLVGPQHLVNAIALNSAMVNAARFVGPTLVGPVFAGMNKAWCFLFDALSFLAVLYGLYHIRHKPSPGTPRPSNRLEHLLEGTRYISAKPEMLQAVVLLFLMSVGGWAYQSQLPAFVKIRLGLGEWGYVGALAAGGLGSCAAALIVATRGARLMRPAILYTGIGIYSCFIFLFGFQHSIFFAALLLFAAAFGVTLFFSSSNSFLQTNSPAPLRGRIMGIWALVFGGGMPVGSFLMGWVASRAGPETALQAGGVLCLLGAFLIYLLLKPAKKP
jgi:predicted MFS family arabinose efflux permease